MRKVAVYGSLLTLVLWTGSSLAKPPREGPPPRPVPFGEFNRESLKEKAPEIAPKLIERLKARLEELEGRLGDDELNKAKELLSQAEAAEASGDHMEALRLARDAGRVLRAAGIVQGERRVLVRKEGPPPRPIPLKALYHKAEEAVKASGDEEGAKAFREACKLMEELKAARECGDREKARRMERKVRALLRRALLSAEAPDIAPRALERTRKALDKAKEKLGDDPSLEEAGKLLDEADKACKACREGECRKALRLVRKAQEELRRAFQRAEVEKAPELAPEAIRRVKARLEELKGKIGDDEKASQLLDKAGELLAKAEEAEASGDHIKALRLARAAGRTFHRAAGIAQTERRLDRAFERMEELLGKAQGVVSASGDERASELLEKAEELAERAEQIREEAPRRAFALALRASRMARRAMALVENSKGEPKAAKGPSLRAHPNPYNARTQISYTLPEAGEVHLVLYNTLGQRVRTLVDEDRPAGTYQVVWDGRDDSGREVAGGVYICRLEAGGAVKTLRVLYLK